MKQYVVTYGLVVVFVYRENKYQTNRYCMLGILFSAIFFFFLKLLFSVVFSVTKQVQSQRDFTLERTMRARSRVSWDWRALIHCSNAANLSALAAVDLFGPATDGESPHIDSGKFAIPHRELFSFKQDN